MTVEAGDAECAGCGARLGEPRRATRKEPAPATAGPWNPVLTHAVALSSGVLLGVLLGALLFGGPRRSTTPDASDMMPFPGHPAIAEGRKAPPLTEEQIREWMSGNMPAHPSPHDGESG
jgi:hypothetical protein